MARAAARPIRLADIELIRQGMRLEPLPEAISKFRSEEASERLPRGLTAPQVLRSLVLMLVKMDYRGLRETDGSMLRHFSNFYCDPVPEHTHSTAVSIG